MGNILIPISTVYIKRNGLIGVIKEGLLMVDVKHYTFIEGKNLSLCAANIDNINLYASWDNNPDVRKYTHNLFPKTSAEHKKYMESGQDRTPREIGFEVWHKGDDKPIGFIRFNYIDWADRLGNYSLQIGDLSYWNKNLELEATFLLLEYAFNELNLVKITTDMYEMNTASWKICEKLGMNRELVLKKQAYLKGKYVDIYQYSLFKDDWENLRQKIEF
ncbi:MAG: GNAT family N-acetyltransferase [Candidatus Thorarchaeota archaeon]